MSRIVIKNPENIASLDPHMTSVIKHINQILRWKLNKQPDEVTGYIRGPKFFSKAVPLQNNDSTFHLVWNDTRLTFGLEEGGFQGLHLYATKTGAPIGLICFFNIMKSINTPSLPRQILR